MRAAYKWIVGCSLWVPVFIACGGSNTSNFTDDDAGQMEVIAADGAVTYVPSSSGASETFKGGAPPPMTTVDSLCKAGFYQGTFTGTYSSHITVVGIGIPVTGNVELTLNQKGTAAQQCTINNGGEGLTTESCNNVFTLSGGTIQGTADGLFPYFCTMTGTLDCAKLVLDDGWIECTYCAIGVIPDGGGITSSDPLANCTGAGGNFAGILKANYNTSTLSFTNGSWNGAEALCSGIAGTSTASCNDGGSPGPDGGSPDNYLVLDGGYGLAPNYGGSGQWGASCVNCAHD
jgi:hypothetical protein